jgi:hypothetical protein
VAPVIASGFAARALQVWGGLMTPGLFVFVAIFTHITPALWWGTYAALDLAWDAVTEWHRTGTI